MIQLNNLYQIEYRNSSVMHKKFIISSDIKTIFDFFAKTVDLSHAEIISIKLISDELMDVNLHMNRED